MKLKMVAMHIEGPGAVDALAAAVAATAAPPAHPKTYTDVLAVYGGSDGEATKALYARLETCGPAGVIALNLFRACKASARAKVYRGGARGRGSFRRMAYDKKEWSMGLLADALAEHGDGLGIVWGWAEDPAQAFHRWVLYVELPTGQVSFHAEHRGRGRDFTGAWDGVREQAAQRICRFAAQVLEAGPTSAAR